MILSIILIDKIIMKFTEEKDKEIIRLYESGLDTVQIGKMFDTYNTSIRRVLIRHNVQLRGATSRSIVKSNSFINLNDDETQYWLGYIAADGCVKTKGNVINISTNLDPDHLDTYIKFIKYPLTKHSYLNKRYNVYEYSVNFSHAETYNYLINLGIIPQKSLKLEMKIPLTWSFIRGYFDGNGSVRYTTDNKITLTICSGSNAFINQLHNFFTFHHITSYIRTQMRVQPFYVLDISINNNIKTIYQNFYKDSSVYLIRKKDKFGSAMGKLIV